MLVGRDSERAAIERLLADARVGTSGVLVVSGEPGIGKSSLLAHAATAAHDMRVLSARGIEEEASIPFAGLLELLRPVIEHVKSLPAPQAAALRAALALGPGVGGERLVIGAATLGVLAAAAERQPLCVLVDDAQWVDQPSAEAILFAARRLLADPVAIIVGVRSGEPSPLSDAGLPLLALTGLDLEASETLLASERDDPVPHGSAERLFRATGGNPLALIELAGEAETVAGSLVDGPLPIATTVERAFAVRAARLSEPARRSLLVVAAASTADLGLIAQAGKILDVDIAALQEAEAAGLVVVSDGRIRFRHPLVRSAVHNSAEPSERRAAHAALAQRLVDERYADEQAWHLGRPRSGPTTSPPTRSPRPRPVHASAEPTRRLRSRRSARPTSLPMTPAAGAGCSRQPPTPGSPAAASALSACWTKPRRSSWTARSRSTSGNCAGMWRSRAETPCRRARSSSSRPSVRRGDPHRAARLLAEAAYASFYAGRVGPMLEDARAACAALAADDEGVEACMARIALGMALVFCDAGDEGPRALRAAVRMAGYARMLEGPPLLWRWAWEVPLFLRETRTTRESLDRSTAAARERGVPGALLTLLCLSARDAATTDRWPEARARYYEAADLAQHTGQPGEACSALSGLAWLEAREGREESCRAHAQSALTSAREYGRGFYEAWALAALGDLELALGRPAEAVERLSDMSAALERLGIADVDLSPAPELAEALVQCGRGAEAVGVAAAYRRRAAGKGQPWALARAARAEGLVGDDEAFPDWFEQALRWHDLTPDTFERARSELAYGERLRRARRRGDARSHLRAALTAFRQLGAEPWAERARLELAATGETARKRDPSTLDQLTPRELQIALELASGLTTREAAAKLYLSPKTIEYHLRSVYRKLGIASRGELAEAVARVDRD